MCISRIKLVTFDATNTLLKFRVPPSEYYASVLVENGINSSEAQIKQRFADSYSNMWKLHPNFGSATITWPTWWREVIKLTLNDIVPKSVNLDSIATRLINEFGTEKCWYCTEGGSRLINFFRSKGANVGIISNFDPRLHYIIKNLGLSNQFDFVLTSYECGFFKPDLRIFNYAISRCKNSIKSSEALHIGDDLIKDYQGAQAAGWNAILITNNRKIKTPLPGINMFSSLNELALAIQCN